MLRRHGPHGHRHMHEPTTIVLGVVPPRFEVGRNLLDLKEISLQHHVLRPYELFIDLLRYFYGFVVSLKQSLNSLSTVAHCHGSAEDNCHDDSAPN